jgi:hypothetical protein
MRKFKNIILPILFAILIITGGCSINLDEETADSQMQIYDGSSGYSLNIPADWTKGEETTDKVEFHDPTNQIALSITSELGGVDYFSMKEIKEQLIENIASVLFSDYDITDDTGGTKYFDVVMEGTDQDGAKIVADIYAYEPYVTMRHYLVFIASNEAYEKNAALIDEIKASFTIIFSEEEYLQLMDEQREAAQTETSEDETSLQILDENETQN